MDTLLKIRLTAAEREAITAAAGGAEVSTWARLVLLRAAAKG